MRVSLVSWERFRRILFTSALIFGVLGGVSYLLGGSKLLLNANGIVVADQVSVAAPYEARIKRMYVRPGDHIEAGQLVATVESAAMSRMLADLSAEDARLTSRIAQLEARIAVVEAVLPVAEEEAKRVKSYKDQIDAAGANGVGVPRHIYEAVALNLAAEEHALGLKAEQQSLATELAIDRRTLLQVTASLNDLASIYNNGNFYAPVSGYVSSTIASPGDILSTAGSRIARIYTGPNYVVAYIPEEYWFDIQEGAAVSVKAHGQTFPGTVERVLPESDAVPLEFQLPNRARNRSQVVRITFAHSERLTVEQKVMVVGCRLFRCASNLAELAWNGARAARQTIRRNLGDVWISEWAARHLRSWLSWMLEKLEPAAEGAREQGAQSQ